MNAWFDRRMQGNGGLGVYFSSSGALRPQATHLLLPSHSSILVARHVCRQHTLVAEIFFEEHLSDLTESLISLNSN